MSKASEIVKIAKMARDIARANEALKETLAKLADFEKRSEAEDFLVEMSSTPGAPRSLVPVDVADFIAKRDVISSQGLEVAKLAAKLADGDSYVLGEAEDNRPLFNDNGSRADAEFTNYLLTSRD